MAHYFGDSARDVFFTQYHHLARHRLIEGNKKNNLSKKALQDTKHVKDETGMGAIARVSLLPKFDYAVDFPFAPKRPNTAGPQLQSITSTFGNQSSFLLDQSLSNGTQENSMMLTSYYSKRSEAANVPTSPRTNYLEGCLSCDLKPRASLILRKNITTEINLKHDAMGDKMAVIFAKSLCDLPLITSLNLCDNALTDEGVSAIINAICHLRYLVSLDLSKNKIDGAAAASLAEYLKRPGCPIRHLTLSGADIDDTECDNFISALRYNTTLTELDMSNNKIGISENLNVVKPDFRTGAEALANFLRSTDCPLITLKLEWNMIRLDGSVTFASAIRFNSSLTYLDVSYNSLGRFGGEMLGDSLVDNKTLRTLKAGGNSLNATACFTICVGIEQNFVIRNVNLDNNPIGVQGAKALLELPTTVGNRVRVSAERCNISVVEQDFQFDRHDPRGYRELNLENSFERAVAFKILQIIANQSSYSLFIKYEPPAMVGRLGSAKKNGKPLVRGGEIKLIRGFSNQKVLMMDDEQKALMAQLKKVARAAMDMDAAMSLFNEFDEDGSGARVALLTSMLRSIRHDKILLITGSIDHQELFKLLEKLGVDVDEKTVNAAMAVYDVDGQGSLEMNEFLQFLRSQHDESLSRLKEMAECPIMCLASNPGERYLPPRRGKLIINVTDTFQTTGNQKVMSSFDYNNIVKLVKESNLDIADSFKLAIKNSKLRLAEARKIFSHIYSETRDKSKSVGVLLPTMLDAKQSRALIEEVIGDDEIEMNKLKTLLGSAIKPILGLYDGFYDLDLARETDRVCILQLIERSQDVSEHRKKLYETIFGNGVVGDCSQNQNWSAFRNEYFNGAPFLVSPAMFTPFPTKGKLMFDFCASDHPPPSAVPISDKRCVNCLFTLGMIEESDKNEAMHALDVWREYAEETCDGTGREIPIADYKRAYIIQDYTNKFYSCMKERLDQLAIAARREDLLAFQNRQLNTSPNRSRKDSLSKRGRSSTMRKSSTSVRKQSTSSTTSSAVLTANLVPLTTGDEASEDEADAEEDPTPTRQAGDLTQRSLSQENVDSARSKGEGGNIPTARSNASKLSNPDRVANAPMNPIIKSASSEAPVKKIVQEEEDDDIDLEYFELFTPKVATRRTVLPNNGLNGKPSFSFDFLDEIVEEVAEKPASEPERGRTETKDSLDSFEEEDKATPGLINALQQLSSLTVARGSSQRNLNLNNSESAHNSQSNTPRHESRTVVPRRRQMLNISNSVLEELTSVRVGTIVRKASSLSIAIDYMNEKMEKIAERLRRRSMANLPLVIKANTMVDAIEKIFTNVWLKARHLALIITFFTYGKEKKTNNFGTYRVEIFISLFGRVTDPQNLDVAIKALTPYEAACVYSRIGWLNLFDPMKPDGCHVLDLSRPDERVVIKILAALSAVEPGENIRASRFRWKWEDDDLAGWVLLAPWVSEEHMPHRGVMFLEYYSGEGEGLRGCVANVAFRKSLLSLVYSYELDFSNLIKTNEEEAGEADNKTTFTVPSTTVGMRYAALHLDFFKKMFFVKNVIGHRSINVGPTEPDAVAGDAGKRKPLAAKKK